MPSVDVKVPVYLPDAALRLLRAIKRNFRRTKVAEKVQGPLVQNLIGDRDIEWSYVLSRIPDGKGMALEFGPGHSCLGLAAALRGFHVTSVDLNPPERMYSHPRLKFILGDLLKTPLPENHFDLVINCSTVEHVGLKGRYGVTEEFQDGDLEAMHHLATLMKTTAIMLATIPIGQDAVFEPMCRVYGSTRLPLLLRDFAIEEEQYWMKESDNRWIITEKEQALKFRASAGSWNAEENIYALGCFVLRRNRL